MIKPLSEKVHAGNRELRVVIRELVLKDLGGGDGGDVAVEDVGEVTECGSVTEIAVITSIEVVGYFALV